jgi:hypothetical protein
MWLKKKIIPNHHWNVIQFNKIQKKIIQINVLVWKKNIFNHYVIESTLIIKLIFFHLDKYQ